MWQILSSYGIPRRLLNLVMGLYRETKCRIIHRGKLGEWFTIQSGVKQGCVLSPLLFLLVLDWVMRKTNAQSNGIQWSITTRLDDLDFADDICLLTHVGRDMEIKWNRLIHYGKQVGLNLNSGKTKILRVCTSGNCALTIDGEQITEVDSFKYLGSIITKDGGADDDVQSRIQKARQSFGALNNIWRSSQISRNLKIRIFKTNCLSVLLYGCETWKVTGSIASQIQVFVNKCLRRILKIFWPNVISNEDLWRITGVENTAVMIRRRKWNWIGHTLRRPSDDIAKAALDWNPQGNRKRGRPKITWKRTIIEEARDQGKTWSEVKALALNRVRWRHFVGALCPPAE